MIPSSRVVNSYNVVSETVYVTVVGLGKRLGEVLSRRFCTYLSTTMSKRTKTDEKSTIRSSAGRFQEFSSVAYIGGSTSRSYISSFPRPVASPKSAIPTIANISPTQLPSPTLLKVNFTSLPPGTIVEISFVTSLAMSYSGPVRRKQIALISF